jgi:integrase
MAAGKRERNRKGGGTVFQRHKKGKWIGEISQLTDRKRTFRRVYGSTKTEVQTRLKQLQIEIAESRTCYDVSTETVRDYFSTWIESLTSSPSTLLRHESLLKLHVFPHDFARIRLSDISTKAVEQFYAILKLTVSASTLKKVHMVLHAGFEAALHSRTGVNRNPCSLPKNQIPKYKPAEAYPMSEEKEAAFLRAADGNELEALYILALDGGMRQGELFALEWRDLNWSSRKLQVDRTLKDTKRGLGVGPTKGKQRRSLNVSKTAIEALGHHKKRQARLYGIQPLMFPDRVGGWIRRQNFNRRSFAPLLAKAASESGLSFEGHTFHDLRHTLATLNLSAGEPITLVSERLGHANVATTLNTYAHCLPQDEDRLASRFDERFDRRLRSS